MHSTLQITFLLTILPSALGAACTRSTASQYVVQNEGCTAADLARDDTGCVKEFCSNGGTPASLQTCFCIALGESNCGSSSSGSSLARRSLAGAAVPRLQASKRGMVTRRQTFECNSSQTCYINPADGGLFCLDKSTGDYVGESGDSGNVDTGSYTPASGMASTSASAGSATAGSATAATRTRTSTTDSETESSSSLPTGSASITGSAAPGASGANVIGGGGSSTSASGGGASAGSSSSSTAGMARVTAGAGAVFGALGFAVGVVF